MTERTALGEAILKHWREHCPRMVSDLERTGLLNEALAETQSRTGDLLYELVSVKKMEYHAAWELVMEQWALTETETPPRSPRRSPPKSKSATSPRKKPRHRRRATSA